MTKLRGIKGIQTNLIRRLELELIFMNVFDILN